MADNSRAKNELEKKIALLPKGTITYKIIRGKRRMYLQWSEDGQRKSKYIKAENEREVLEAVKYRKQLEEELGRLLEDNDQALKTVKNDDSSFKYETRVVTGDNLTQLCRMTDGFGKRECYSELKRFLDSAYEAKVCVIYGLRRTGKTVLSLQALSELQAEKSAYIKMLSTDNMAMLNRDLMRLQKEGIRYVFVDEITLMQDFADSASLLSDIYAASGIKMVLSGTDSLGFALAMDDELYDRVFLIHTTFIPFREYSRLLGYRYVDEYIRYGGTFRAGELNFDDEDMIYADASFRDDESTRRYIDTSIARNIQHSLEGYRSGGHFRHLIDLYEAGELTNVINRVIEDMNHRFVLSVLKRDFVSHDLGSARQLDRKHAAKQSRESVLDQIDEKSVVDRLKHILDIRDKNELAVDLTMEHVKEIKQYLYMLDLIVDVPSESIDSGRGIENIIFSQPGMRYCQAQALVYSLMQDDSFLEFSAEQRKAVIDRILEEVRGRMLEDIVLLETAKTLPRWKRAFKLMFEAGEFDMVVFDQKTVSCAIYEIKHSNQITEQQYRHLVDEEKLKRTEFQYGHITDRILLYNGEECMKDGVHYVNVVEYMEGLKPLRPGSAFL